MNKATLQILRTVFGFDDGSVSCAPSEMFFCTTQRNLLKAALELQRQGLVYVSGDRAKNLTFVRRAVR